MDFLNELFGSEMGELKRHQKVRISTHFQLKHFHSKQALMLSPFLTMTTNESTFLERGGNQEILHQRRIHRAKEGCALAQERL
jgi:hypothetical protein